MINEIKNCKKCELHNNQRPLLDKIGNSRVIWVGLSAKEIKFDNETPLSSTTNSGRVIAGIEKLCAGIPMYKTNLVKCLPLDLNRKLRYPSKDEATLCASNLDTEIKAISPDVVFLLGVKVAEAIGSYYKIEFDKWNEFDYRPKIYDGTCFVPIHHPSYIYVYKRKYINDYISELERIILRFVKNDGRSPKYENFQSEPQKM